MYKLFFSYPNIAPYKPIQLFIQAVTDSSSRINKNKRPSFLFIMGLLHPLNQGNLIDVGHNRERETGKHNKNLGKKISIFDHQ